MATTRGKDCPFCNIDGERNRIVWRGANASVILSNPRLMYGHLLVVPKAHYEQPWHMKAHERKEIFDTVLRFQQLLIERGFGEGVDIRQNYRPFLKQSRVKVDHIHYHLLPREFEDEYYQQVQHAEVFEDLVPEEAQFVLRKLR